MPLTIATALTALRSLPWRRMLPVAGIAAALWFAFDTGRDNMRAKLQPRIDLLTRERDTARANIGVLEAAMVRQNAAIADAAAKGKAAQDKAAEAARRGKESDKATAALIARLAAVQASGGRCVTPGAVHEAWEKM